MTTYIKLIKIENETAILKEVYGNKKTI